MHEGLASREARPSLADSAAVPAVSARSEHVGHQPGSPAADDRNGQDEPAVDALEQRSFLPDQQRRPHTRCGGQQDAQDRQGQEIRDLVPRDRPAGGQAQCRGRQRSLVGCRSS
jgi:hypothetical protein